MNRHIAGIVFFVLAAAVPPSLAAAAEAVPVRAADHGNFGRIVFDWAQPVGHSVSVQGHELAVSFDRPMDASVISVLKSLKKYVTAARLDNDARTAVFVLAGDFAAEDFENGSSVAVDIRPAGAPALAVLKPAAGAPPKIGVRTGVHPDFSRVVFDWPYEVAYTASESGGALTLDFAAPAEFALGKVRAKLPPQVTGIETAASAAGNSVTIRAPEGAQFKHFRSKTKVVVDISVPESAIAMRPADGPSPAPSPDTREKDAAPEPVAPAPKKKKMMVAEMDASGTAKDTAGAPVSLLPLKPRPVPQPPAPQQKLPPVGQSLTNGLTPAGGASGAPATETKAETKAETKTPAAEPQLLAKAEPPIQPETPAASRLDMPIGEMPPAETKLPDFIKLAPDGAAKVAAVAVAAKSVDGGLALTFPFTAPVPAAVFRRAGNIWIVFGQDFEPDLAALAEWRKEVAAEIVETPGATALRLAAGNGLSAQAKRDGAAFTVVLSRKAAAPAAAPAPEGRKDGLFVAMTNAGPVVSLADPSIGDVISVVPVLAPGPGMAAPREYALFRLPATVTGLVVEPKADGILVRADADGIAITSPGGLLLSEANGGRPAESIAKPSGAAPPEAVEIEISAPHFFDFAGWSRGDTSFEDTRKYLQHVVLASKGAERTQARLDLARFFFARGFYADALGLLRVAATDDPTAANDADYLALRGGCLYLMEDYAGATADFNSPVLIPNPEAQLWRGALAASQGLWPEAVRAFSQVGDRIQEYPQALKVKFALLAAETAVNSNEFEAAETYLKFIEDTHPDAAAAAGVKYLRGKLAETQRDYETAATLYGEAARDGDPATAAKAQFAGVAMLWGSHKIRAQEAIAALEDLRFAWRGDSFEFEVLRLLGDLYIETAEYEKGLRTLKRAVTFFPEHPRARESAELMSATFAKLYVDGEADKLSPLKALGLYDEFKELTPPGEAGDAMARKLAERLVAVDLLEQAAAVLEPQVTARLEGSNKAQWGARLATIRLLDKKPELALKALSESEAPELPAELVQERKVLEARALADQGKVPESMGALGGLDGRDAELLRAEILWRQHDWAGAAGVLARLTDPFAAEGAKLEDADAALVVKRAAALWMADDRDALADMRDKFTAAMTPTTYNNDFRVIAAAPMGAIDSVAAIAERISDIDAYADFAAGMKGGHAAASETAPGETKAGETKKEIAAVNK